MYRCYLLCDGRIGLRDDADSETLDDAVARCVTLLSIQTPDKNFQGFEIWQGTSLIYSNAMAKV